MRASYRDGLRRLAPPDVAGTGQQQRQQQQEQQQKAGYAGSGGSRGGAGAWRIARLRVLLQRATAARPCAACAMPLRCHGFACVGCEAPVMPFSLQEGTGEGRGFSNARAPTSPQPSPVGREAPAGGPAFPWIQAGLSGLRACRRHRSPGLNAVEDVVPQGSGASRPWMACGRALEPGTAEPRDAPDPCGAAAPSEASAPRLPRLRMKQARGLSQLLCWLWALRRRIRAGETLALALGAAEQALADRQGVAVEAPVVDHAEGQDAGDVVAGFLVADGLDPQ